MDVVVAAGSVPVLTLEKLEPLAVLDAVVLEFESEPVLVVTPEPEVVPVPVEDEEPDVDPEAEPVEDPDAEPPSPDTEDVEDVFTVDELLEVEELSVTEVEDVFVVEVTGVEVAVPVVPVEDEPSPELPLVELEVSEDELELELEVEELEVELLLEPETTVVAACAVFTEGTYTAGKSDPEMMIPKSAILTNPDAAAFAGWKRLWIVLYILSLFIFSRHF